MGGASHAAGDQTGSRCFLNMNPPSASAPPSSSSSSFSSFPSTPPLSFPSSFVPHSSSSCCGALMVCFRVGGEAEKSDDDDDAEGDGVSQELPLLPNFLPSLSEPFAITPPYWFSCLIFSPCLSSLSSLPDISICKHLKTFFPFASRLRRRFFLLLLGL